MENSSAQSISLLSPSYYYNLLLSASHASINTVSAWAINPVKKLVAQVTAFKLTTGRDWERKYEKHAQDDAATAALIFKKALEQSARKAYKNNSTNIMARFIDNNTFHPEKFFFGASSSSYQVEGSLDTNNASARFYSQQGLPIAGKAIDFWNRYPSDIVQMKKELGINSFRLSIAWDRVEPQEGKYDYVAIQRYVDIIRTLKNNGIEPIVVLHHYTVPTWFEDKGGFKNSDNIHHFVDFATTMYNRLYDRVTYWSTFNAIEGYAFKGYFLGDGPPGNPEDKDSMLVVATVMYNMLCAHADIYANIKKLYQEKKQHSKLSTFITEPQIGIQKNIVPLDPSHDTLLHSIASPLTRLFTYFGTLLQNEGFFTFFTAGTYDLHIPTKLSFSQHKDNARNSLDWIGINIYSNIKMFLKGKLTETVEDKQTMNFNYRDYPEGIYRATEIIYEKIALPLNKPIIITENGIATNDDNKRTRFFRRALYVIRKLIEEDYPIIGYTPWAAHDNYEWPSKEQPDAFDSRRYGFFNVNFDKNSPNYLKRTLKSGAHYYHDFLSTFFLQPNKPLITYEHKLSAYK